MNAKTELFDTLCLWIDPEPRDGPEQMACDEVLLAVAERPVLRIFRWRRPWVSAGYFADMVTAAQVRPDLPLCRRWTGGGIVVHEGDFTFALVVPRGEKLASERPVESYRQIHRALVEALVTAGVPASLAGQKPPVGEECFAHPVLHDVLAQDRKIAGGAQRRTRAGLLHQGSVQGAGHEDFDLAPALARTLSASVEIWTPSERLGEQVRELTTQKYAAEGFLEGPKQPMNFTGR